MIRVVALVATALGLSTALAAAAPPPRDAVTGASAALVRISVPGKESVVLGELAWPASTTTDVQSFQYPDDGSIVSIGRSHASVSAQPGSNAAAAHALAEVIVLSLFGGDVVAAQVTASTSAGASARAAGASVSASAVQGLRALEQDVSTKSRTRISLEDWGTLEVLSVSEVDRKSVV